jgi:hypothetical protein
VQLFDLRLSLGTSSQQRKTNYFLLYCVALLGVYARTLWIWIGQGLPLAARSDFVIFYTAGEVIRAGRATDLYSLALQTEVQQQLLAPYQVAFPDGLLPYNYPPFAALTLLPLTFLPLEAAFVIWTTVNLALIGLTLRVLLNYLGFADCKTFAWAVLLNLSFFPVFEALVKGQTSLLMLLLMSTSIVSLSRGQSVRAGVLLALGLFKPQLTIIAVIVLVLQRHWRALAGFSVTAGVLLLTSLLVVGLHGVIRYVQLLVEMSRWNCRYAICPIWMANWRGLAERLGAMLHMDLNWLATALVLLSLGLIWLIWRPNQVAEKVDFDLGWALTVILSLLVSPHLYGHDLSLWVLAAALYHHHEQRTRPSAQQGLTLIALGHMTAIAFRPLWGDLAQVQADFTWMIIVVAVLSWQLSNYRKCTDVVGKCWR